MKKALIIAGRYTQDHEFIYPFYRLQEANYKVDVAVLDDKETTGFLGAKITPTVLWERTTIHEYDLLVLPGGAKAMEYLRQNKRVLEFIYLFHMKGGVIASICHGAQLLISAKVVKGNYITGYYSIRDDIENAGGLWTPAEAVCSDKIVTSPHYKYLPQWMKLTLEEVEKE
jgi:protease I